MSGSDDSTLPHGSKIDPTSCEHTITDLFGGERKWESEYWTASDDRVRGGQSQSYLKISEEKYSATFHGDLDITALGGAGFASQRTADAAGAPWDLSKADGVAIGLGDIDDRIYTLVLKDTILPKRPDGREQSTISYEFSFSILNNGNDGLGRAIYRGSSPLANLPEKPYALSRFYRPKLGENNEASTSAVIFVPWKAFYPYYRGKREPKDSPFDPLDRAKIKRISIMCRSMFGKQCGHFSVQIMFISTFSVSNIPSIAPEVPLIPLEGSSSTGHAEDAYIFHRPLSPDTTRTPRYHKSPEQDLVENFNELQVERTKKPISRANSIDIAPGEKSAE
ncbi:hypothetical protein TWF718_000051 [Orbilia javanica]|uniref:NADH:ubiquinone oxidoreductase intermediate-associated protein 30 domain-containing protein n=1 Tax=Orbilia javanica TaxID=47235 RepID=A0AAN8N9P6_9PEZI